MIKFTKTGIKMITTNIYYLELDNVPFYIGQSSALKTRAYSHSKKWPKCKLVKLETVKGYGAEFWEQFYIDLFKSWGFILKNKYKAGKNHYTNGQNQFLKDHIELPFDARCKLWNEVILKGQRFYQLPLL